MAKKDIFDRIIELPFIGLFMPYLKKHKETLLYLFFGGLTFILSVLTYAFFNEICKINELIANIISWIIAVTFAYLTNKYYVFRVIPSNRMEFIRQVTAFFSARIVTLIIEEIILFIFITKLHYNSLVIKIVAQVIIIILNYIFSKVFIFVEKLQ